MPIWCETNHEELAEKFGPEYACGFTYGPERGLILANLKPEWARGFYQLLRIHYLQTHTEEDSLDWEDHAEQTVRAIPVAISLGRDRAIDSILRKWPSISSRPSSRRENRETRLVRYVLRQ